MAIYRLYLNGAYADETHCRDILTAKIRAALADDVCQRVEIVKRERPVLAERIV